MDHLKDLDSLKAICRTVLADELKEQDQPPEPTQPEPKADEASGTTPAETYLFVGSTDTHWPASSSPSRRARLIAQRKEESGA